MSIEPMLVLSTSHLPQDLLRDIDMHVTRTIAHDYGVIMWTDGSFEDDEDPATTAVLKPIVEHALSKGCNWINFDSAAAEVEELPTWDW